MSLLAAVRQELRVERRLLFLCNMANQQYQDIPLVNAEENVLTHECLHEMANRQPGRLNLAIQKAAADLLCREPKSPSVVTSDVPVRAQIRRDGETLMSQKSTTVPKEKPGAIPVPARLAENVAKEMAQLNVPVPPPPQQRTQLVLDINPISDRTLDASASLSPTTPDERGKIPETEEVLDYEIELPWGHFPIHGVRVLFPETVLFRKDDEISEIIPSTDQVKLKNTVGLTYSNFEQTEEKLLESFIKDLSKKFGKNVVFMFDESKYKNFFYTVTDDQTKLANEKGLHWDDMTDRQRRILVEYFPPSQESKEVSLSKKARR